MSQSHTNEQDRTLENTVESAALVDNFNRRVNYLRLSVTDRCDLRCRYCCPEKGIELVPHEEILSFEEIIRVVSICATLGVEKIRITGGEPFARRGLLELLTKIKKIEGVRKLLITTNGVQAADKLEALMATGIDGINLSLDTLNRDRFRHITRRNRLEQVLRTFHGAVALNIPIKVNSVVLEDTTDDELVSLISLSKDNPVTVRFIETMPFSGASSIKNHDNGSLVDRLSGLFPAMKEQPCTTPTTARIFSLPGFEGLVGVIEGNSRHFCKTCNKIRITATGMLKTCLYDNGVLDLRELLRSGCENKEIGGKIREAVQHSIVDGHTAEKKSKRRSEPSMAGIGG